MTEESESLPPHDEASEWALLACAIEKPELLNRMQVLTWEAYYTVLARIALPIVVSACEKFPEREQTSVRLLEVSRTNLQVFHKLENALRDLPSPENWPYYHGILDGLADARRILQAKTEMDGIAEKLAGGDRSGVLKMEKELHELATPTEGTAVRTYKETVPSVLTKLQEDYESDGSPRGIPTGLPDIDATLGGMQKGKLIVIGARPSKGKSSLCLSFAESAALNKVKVLICSLEMTAEELAGRTLASFSRINLNCFRTRNERFRATQDHFDKVAFATVKTAGLPITVADRISTLDEISQACSEAIAQGCGLIVIDYLQLIRIPKFKGNRNELVTEISTTLKSIAHTNQIPVVAAAQLGRQSEREKRRPNMSDLRDSGSIEQDADQILLLHSEPKEDEPEPDVLPVEVLVSKNRGGPTGLIHLTFLKQITRFESASRFPDHDVPHYHSPHND